jgi:hypothetical protein
MFIAKKHLTRRTFLRGVGATIALPLLDAMIPAATPLGQTAAKPLPRLGFVYFPHGAVMDRWSPKAVGKDFEFSPILKPLEAFKEQITIVSGLSNKAAEGPVHATTAGTWLNCAMPVIGTSARAGISVDQLAAQQIGQDTPFPSLELATEPGGPCDTRYGCSYGHTISFRTPTQPVPMEYNPRKVFYQLFGQGDSPVERETIVGETKSILDSILGEAATLQSRLTTADRTILSEYLDSVREIERRIQTIEQRDLSRLKLPEPPLGVPNDASEHLNLMLDLIALAWQANLTRISTFMIAKELSMRTFNHIGVPDAFHAVSHHGDNPTNLDKLTRIAAFHSEVFARFAKKLASTPDGDGSLLDHSILLFGSNMSNSNMHNHDPLPSAVLGRGYGRLKGGQHLKYPQGTPLANLLLTLLDRAGVPAEKIGDSTGLLSEV